MIEELDPSLQFVAPRPGDTIRALLNERADAHPDKLYVAFPDHDDFRMSYGNAAAGADTVVHVLLKAGLPSGARVALYLPNGPEYVWSWFAALTGNLVDVSVNPELRTETLAYALEKARVDAVITDATGATNLEALRPLTVSPRVFVFGPRDELPRLRVAVRTNGAEESAEGGPGSIDLPAGDPFALASIRFTSGSTGLPKGVMMSQAHMLASARMFCHMTSFGPEDMIYSCFPVHHVFASVTGLLSALCAGGGMALARKFSVTHYWEHVRTYHATIVHVLDAPANILLSAPNSDLDRAHHCRIAYTTAAADPRFEQRFGIPIIPLFDMSELTAIAYYPPGVERRDGSCGVASTLFDISIVDEFDYHLKAGEQGELVVRPRIPHVMFLGYFDDDKLTVSAWRNLWFHTGDHAILDDDGYLYFRGRSGDRIRRRGVNISAAQIESITAQHPAVGEAAVIGVPAGVTEDDIKVSVSLRADGILSVQELHAYLVAELPKALVPRYFEVRDEFPRTGTQKIRKNILRSEGKHGLTSTTWDCEQAGSAQCS